MEFAVNISAILSNYEDVQDVVTHISRLKDVELTKHIEPKTCALCLYDKPHLLLSARSTRNITGLPYMLKSKSRVILGQGRTWGETYTPKAYVEFLPLHKKCALDLLKTEIKTPGSFLMWLKISGNMKE